jgi:hypothetical protein
MASTAKYVTTVAAAAAPTPARIGLRNSPPVPLDSRNANSAARTSTTSRPSRRRITYDWPNTSNGAPIPVVVSLRSVSSMRPRRATMASRASPVEASLEIRLRTRAKAFSTSKRNFTPATTSRGASTDSKQLR